MTLTAGNPRTARRPVHTTHSVTVAAAAADVYELIADVTRWPHTFAPTVHAEVLDRVGGAERLRLWAFGNGKVRTWTSRRSLDPDALHVGFEQEVPSAPVLGMGGEWRLEPLDGGRTRVELLHDYTAATREAEDFIHQAVDTNSRAELAALKKAVELGADLDRLVLSFDDSVVVEAEASRVYGFLADAGRWPQRLPHVARLDLTEEEPGLQTMEMDTSSTDGSVHTTRSVRVCVPESLIAYKQTTTPPIMESHIGRWTLASGSDGTVATSHHTVVIRPEQVTALLGPDATVEIARDKIRAALGTNSTTTLRHAKAFAENGG